MEEMKGNRSVREVDKEYDFVFIFRGRARRRAWQWASASVAAGSEGGTRASGDARRLRKIRSSPPSFAARSNISHPLGFDRASIRGDDSRHAFTRTGEYLCNDRHGRKKRKKTEGEPVYLVSWSRASVKVICRFISFRMDVSLLGRWRNVCEPFRNREYDVLVGTMLASFHFVELLLTRWSWGISRKRMI